MCFQKCWAWDNDVCVTRPIVLYETNPPPPHSQVVEVATSNFSTLNRMWLDDIFARLRSVAVEGPVDKMISVFNSTSNTTSILDISRSAKVYFG